MQYKQVEKDYFIYIEKNERIMDTMTRFCIDKGISNACVGCPSTSMYVEHASD